MFATVLDEIVGHSEKMCNVGSVIRRVAPTDSPVVILGESGTGKELVARAMSSLQRKSRNTLTGPPRQTIDNMWLGVSHTFSVGSHHFLGSRNSFPTCAQIRAAP